MEYVVMLFLIIWAMKYVLIDMKGRDSTFKTILIILFVVMLLTGRYFWEIVIAAIIVWIIWE